jgi:hypothetical protein
MATAVPSSTTAMSLAKNGEIGFDDLCPRRQIAIHDQLTQTFVGGVRNQIVGGCRWCHGSVVRGE